jgi:hypothetical protein
MGPISLQPPSAGLRFFAHRQACLRSVAAALLLAIALPAGGYSKGSSQPAMAGSLGRLPFDTLLTYSGAPPPTLERLVALDEYFIYEVSYGFLTLGTVEVKLIPDVEWEGERYYRLDMSIVSNPTIPFVGDRRIRYSSLFQVEDGMHRDRRFWRDDLHDGEQERTLVDFDRDLGKVYFAERGEPTDTLDLVEPAIGGSLIFMHSRSYAERPDPYLLEVYVEDERAQITASGSSKVEKRSYKAFDGPVPTYLSAGTTNVNGPFGFSGNFKSWFSTDDLRVPLEAWVKIFIGNVKVKLIHYERNT